MKTLIWPISLALFIPLPALRAQLEIPNAAGVTLGHFHTIVTDVEASTKFWTTLGGTAIRIDGMDVMKFPGVFVFLTKGDPSGGSYGSVVNHVGFMVPNDEEAIAKWKAEGVTAEYLPSAYVPTAKLGYAYTPDDLKVRINRDKSMTAPIGRPLIMLWVSKAAVPDVQAWYVKFFGAKQGQPINNGVSVVGIPGLRLSVVSSIEDPISRTASAVGLVHGAPPDSAFMEGSRCRRIWAYQPKGGLSTTSDLRWTPWKRSAKSWRPAASSSRNPRQQIASQEFCERKIHRSLGSVCRTHRRIETILTKSPDGTSFNHIQGRNDGCALHSNRP